MLLLVHENIHSNVGGKMSFEVKVSSEINIFYLFIYLF